MRVTITCPRRFRDDDCAAATDSRIGAQAAVARYRLLARDRRQDGTHFPTSTLILPDQD